MFGENFFKLFETKAENDAKKTSRPSERVEKVPLNYSFENVERMRAPLEKILEEVSPQIESGAYDLVIGDDASGRAPAIVLKKFLADAYSERGFQVPETRFLAGSRYVEGKKKSQKQTKIEDYLDEVRTAAEKKRGRPLGRVLVVTDTIRTGVSLDPLIGALKENNLLFDVVTLSRMPYQPLEENNAERRWGVDIISGEVSEFAPPIYGAKLVSGVAKNPEEIFSEPLRKLRKQGPEAAEILRIAHEKESLLAAELFEQWRKRHPANFMEKNPA